MHRLVVTQLIRRHLILPNQQVVMGNTKDFKDRQDTAMHQLQFFHLIVIFLISESIIRIISSFISYLLK